MTTKTPHWQTSTEPWVVGNWTILNEDREAQRRGEPFWTLVPPNNYSGGVFCRGPIGRKSLEPETVIYPCGYETEGVDFDGDFITLLLAKLNDSPKEGE